MKSRKNPLWEESLAFPGVLLYNTSRNKRFPREAMIKRR